MGALLAGALILLGTGVVAGVFYVSVVRTARGLPAYTAGLRPASLARPRAQRAAYHVVLRGPPARTTPAGTPSAAHRWRVTAPAAPDDPLCAGEASDGVVAADPSGVRPLEIALPDALYAPAAPRPVPPRLLAVCAEAALVAGPARLEYLEQVVAPGTAVEVVGCVHAGGALAPCDDEAPSRVYRRADRAAARARVRGTLVRVTACATSFALVCFIAALLALRAYDRARTHAG